VYIIHPHTVAYVPSIIVKDILTQLDPEGRRAKWINVLLEYDLEIKHTKIIKGQGLAKLMTEAGVEDIDINFLDICDVSNQTH
jgi:predicted GNAT family acetyltransferase